MESDQLDCGLRWYVKANLGSTVGYVAEDNRGKRRLRDFWSSWEGTKRFEQVRLWHVWRWSMLCGFPEVLLRMSVADFGFYRRVAQWISCSQTGSVFSCAFLHKLVIWP